MPPAGNARSPALPAAGRVAFYVPAWFVVSNLVQAPFAVAAILMLARQGVEAADPRGLSEKLFDPAHVSWPLVGAMQWAGLFGTVVATAFFVKYIDRAPWAAMGFSPARGVLAHWALGLALGGALLATVAGVGVAAGWLRLAAVERDAARAAGILGGAVAILLPAAAVEEITLRGYVLRVLRERYGTARAIGVSAIVFALLHGLNPGFSASPGAVLGLVLAGIYLGVAYVRTERLHLPIAVHLAWNLFEGPVFGLRVSGLTTPSLLRLEEIGPELWTGGRFGPEAGLLLALAMLLHLPVLVLATRALGRAPAQGG